ncbi:hypothetical protein [Segetibacter sp.]|nr:hypothetical protein [Segetibacter sp.]
MKQESSTRKDENGDWSVKYFSEMDEVIALPFFQVQLTLADIYS